MMMTKNRQQKANGAALILVVVVTVLLAVIGVMFLMVSRLSEMETAAIADQRDLDAAVQTVVTRIDEVLVTDLFGLTRTASTDVYGYDDIIVDADEAAVGSNALNIYADESYDYPVHYSGIGDDGTAGTFDDAIGLGPNGVINPVAISSDDVWLPGQMDDYWLASVEPKWLDAGPDGLTGTAATMQDDTYAWPHITDLWGTIQGAPESLYYQRYDAGDHAVIFSNNLVDKIWIDPDDTTNATLLWYGWNTATKRARWQVSAENVRIKVIAPDDRMNVVAVDISGSGSFPDPWQNANATDTSLFGARADADGDGVADSRWVKVPGLTTSRGKSVYAAVRIIDNGAMLNLNGAHCFYQEDTYDSTASDRISSFETSWNYFVDNGTSWDITPFHDNQSTGSGRFLTEINYFPFLRGHDLNGDYFFGSSDGDYWLNIMTAKNMTFTDTITGFGSNQIPVSPQASQSAFFNIDNPNYMDSFFDISDELEIRNRYLLTSKVEARFEQKNVANYTLDSGGGVYSALEVPRDNSGNTIDIWYKRIDPTNFDEFNPQTIANDDKYTYDRRHVCTFYSLDRSFRRGAYPLLDSEIDAYATANLSTSGYTTVAPYKEYLWTLWGPIFQPIGPVTTDISYPIFNSATGLWEADYNNTETRRRILHLLYALREYYLLQINPAYETMDLTALTAAEQTQLDADLREAALKAAQIVANLIDFSDDNSLNTPVAGETEGPFYDGSANPTDYGQQANVDCTFITEQIIEDMIDEVSGGLIPVGTLSFGLNPVPTPDIVFGYERQPFISDVYVNWDGGPSATPGSQLLGFAIELVNPYDQPISLSGWTFNIGSLYSPSPHSFTTANGTISIPAATSPSAPGRLILRSGTVTITTSDTYFIYNLPDPTSPSGATLVNWIEATYLTQDVSIKLLRPAPAGLSSNSLCADIVDSTVFSGAIGFPGEYMILRDDTDWKFVFADYAPGITISVPADNKLGTINNVSVGTSNGFQLAVPDDQYPLCRWHDLEVLSLFGNDDAAAATPLSVTDKIFAAAATDLHYDLATVTSNPSGYLCTINRPDTGTLPGRININTAPVHVIAAAIPPTLADPNIIDPNGVVAFSALDLAQTIVDYRDTNGPYKKLSDLLNISGFKQYTTGGIWADENVGQQSIDDDIEERDWILSNLANKFTVRSDVFTAYILVRLGEDGPQRRMVAIFDRSNVWDNTDRPRLVALHSVPDSR